ncbi:MAG: hypothetical protein EOP83_03575 [Verrucomicrobiaceae bacterium]|nr:MAG: hypothetical protein EOP83_03575 [Verrucomicrobiaceae bacterium]
MTEGVRFLTCNYCEAHLEIVQDQATTHTRLLEGIEQRTKKIERDVEAIRIQGELKHLDEAWAKYEARVDPRDERGRRAEPTGGLFGIGLVGFVIGIAVCFTEAWWLGVPLALAAAWFMVKAFRWEMNRGRMIQGMRLQYEMRRKMLMQLRNGRR